jgi:hypothetical protein
MQRTDKKYVATCFYSRVLKMGSLNRKPKPCRGRDVNQMKAKSWGQNSLAFAIDSSSHFTAQELGSRLKW